MKRIASAVALAAAIFIAGVAGGIASAEGTGPAAKGYYCQYLKTWQPEQYKEWAPCGW